MSNQSDVIKECLQKQIDELDMLQSIYCNSGELQLQDQFTVLDIREFIDGKSQSMSSKLSYSISLSTETRNKIEVNIELPHLYPSIETALISVRSGNFTTAQEKAILRMVNDYVDNECDKLEPYIFQVVSWVQDNLEKFMEAKAEVETKDPKSEGIEYERLWIYSHHIKSKTKRQNIIKAARELDLTGFMRPGKPGIICVEGPQTHVQEFWKVIRQWQWQKLQIRKSEVWRNQGTKIGRFEQFREQLFTTNEDDEEVPMDMSMFMKFLEAHNCAYIKEYIFGF